MPKVTVYEAAPEQDLAALDAGLESYNYAAAPLKDVRPLTCLIHEETGVLVGGAHGRSWGLCAELRQLWVREDMRGQGLGRYLLEAFEAEAQKRGCNLFYLETFSFQAPKFYEAMGYHVALEISGYAPGIFKFLMTRRV